MGANVNRREASVSDREERVKSFRVQTVIWAVLGLAAVLLGCVLAFSFFCSDRLPPVSVTTTYITEPLDQYGRPDYRQWMLDEMGTNFPVEQNGIRYLLPYVVDPADENFGVYVKSLKLGRELLPTTTEFARWYEDDPYSDAVWRARDVVEDPDKRRDLDQAHAIFSKLEPSEIPWRSTDFPQVLQWLEVNSTVIDAIDAASKSPVIYLPPLEAILPTATSTTLTVDVQLGVSSSSFRRLLAARAMLKCGEGDFDGAISDIGILDRYRASVRYFAIVGLYLRMRLEEYSVRAKVKAAEAAADVSPAHASVIYDSIPVSPDYAAWIKPSITQERVFQLAFVESPEWRLQRSELLGGVGADRNWVLEKLAEGSMDLEYLQQRINSLIDLVEDTVAARDSESLDDALLSLRAEIDEYDEVLKSKFLRVQSFVDRSARSRLVASEFFVNLNNTWTDVAINIRQGEVYYRVLRIAAWIAKYRAVNGGMLPPDLAAIRVASLADFQFFADFDVDVQYEKLREDAYAIRASYSFDGSEGAIEWAWDGKQDTAAELNEAVQPIIERHQKLLDSFRVK